MTCILVVQTRRGGDMHIGGADTEEVTCILVVQTRRGGDMHIGGADTERR